MLDNWGLKDMAKTWKKESIEEMVHADRFVDRILFLEGFPNLQTLDQLRIGETVKEVIECDLKAELEARTLYQEAAKYCREVGDFPSEDLFKALMKDEEGHIDFLETQLDLISRIGIELYTQKPVSYTHLTEPLSKAPLDQSPVVPPQEGRPLRVDNSARGIALVLLSAIFMCSGDIASKYLATTLPALQITWMRYGLSLIHI